MGRGPFSKWQRRNSPAAFAALQLPDIFFSHNFLITAAFIQWETCECSLAITNTAKSFSFFVTLKPSVPGFVVMTRRKNRALQVPLFVPYKP